MITDDSTELALIKELQIEVGLLGVRFEQQAKNSRVQAEIMVKLTKQVRALQARVARLEGEGK